MDCKKRKFLSYSLAVGFSSLLQGCDRSSNISPPIPTLSIEEVLSILFDLVSVSVPVGRYLRISYSMASGVLGLDLSRGSFSMKFPFQGDKRIIERDKIIQDLQRQLDEKGGTPQVIKDDGTIFIVIEGRDDVRVIPVKSSKTLCFYTVGSHKFEVINSESSGKIIIVKPMDKISYLYISETCNNNKIVRVEILESSDIGIYSNIEFFDYERDEWVTAGVGPRQVDVPVLGSEFRIRVMQGYDELWDLKYEKSDLPEGCASFKLNLVLYEDSSLNEEHLLCD